MIKNIWRDYFHDTTKSLLYRQGLIESKHLMYQFGGVPTINAKIWEDYRDYVQYLGFKTDKRRFVVSKKLFDDNKVIHRNGKEKQYWCDKFFYTITELEQKELELDKITN